MNGERRAKRAGESERGVRGFNVADAARFNPEDREAGGGAKDDCRNPDKRKAGGGAPERRAKREQKNEDRGAYQRETLIDQGNVETRLFKDTAQGEKQSGENACVNCAQPEVFRRRRRDRRRNGGQKRQRGEISD